VHMIITIMLKYVHLR